MFIMVLFETIFVMFLLSLIFYIVSLKTSMDTESVSSYECGFDFSSKTRVMFSYRFFLISILFLVFDVEIALMLPVPYFSFISGSCFFFPFLVILVLGLLFEYFMGMLNWL